MVRPPLCLAQEPSLTSSAKPSLSETAHERCSVKTEAEMEPPCFLPLDLYGSGMWEHFWVALWSHRVLVTVFSSHSVQTPKASSSLAFDLQCRKRGWGKFVSSPHFGWQRGMPCPHCTGGLFHPAISAPSYIPGTTKTFSPTRSKALGPGEAAATRHV